MINRPVGSGQTLFHLRNEFTVGNENADKQFYGSEWTDRTHKDHETTITQGNPGQIRCGRLRLRRDPSEAPARSSCRRTTALQGLVEAVRRSKEGTEPSGCNASFRTVAVEGRNSTHRWRG